MMKTSLEEMIAHRTGDDLREIRRLGFQLADPESVSYDPEPTGQRPNILDWDEVDRNRNVSIF